MHHLRNRIADPRNTVLITGWQAQETLGRRLLEGHKRVKIFGEEHNVRAEIVKMNGLSGHADADELVSWVQAINKQPRKTFLVHGELAFAQALQKRLQAEIHLEEVFAPELHKAVTI